jgi:hypothetical protein
MIRKISLETQMTGKKIIETLPFKASRRKTALSYNHIS